jgi:cell wall-associated NlpC family hydrolase
MSALALVSEQRELYGDVDLSQLVLDPKRKGVAGLDIASSITAASVERTIEGASTVTITVRDRDRSLLRSGLLEQVIDIRVDKLWFRLAAVNKQGDDLTLTFEDREVAILRTYDKPRKAVRGKVTRAEFAQMLVREARPPIRFVSPELHLAQPIEKVSRTAKDLKREQGLADDAPVTVKGVKATKEQRQNIEGVLDVGVALSAPVKVLITAVMVITQESSARNLAGGDGTSAGLFQIIDSNGTLAQRRDLEWASTWFFTRAIAENKKVPGRSKTGLAQAVQRSAFPNAYAKWEDEATLTVNAYGKGGTDVVTEKPYEFTRGVNGQREDTWTCLGRLADEVGWRRFAVSGTIYFVSEIKLFASRPRMRVSEETEGVDQIDFDWDPGKKAQQATISCHLARWQAPPGSVTELLGQGPANGRWLVSSVRRSLFATAAEVTLRRPQAKKPEPAPETTTSSFSAEGATTQREAIVEVARKALAEAPYAYKQRRPMHANLFSAKAKSEGIDCSEFVTLVYKAAGAPDPNENDYNGAGSTASLVRKGGQVASPKIGDLVFYGDPSSVHGHVAVFVGKGKVISMGSANGPRELAANYRPVHSFRSYVPD